jgi:DNA-binding protein HU-beta
MKRVLANKRLIAYSCNIENTILLYRREYMAKAMTKSQLVAKLAERASLTKKAASDILEFIAEVAYKEAKNTFTLPGIGKLVLVQRKARMGRNPATGEAIKIKAKKVVKFRVAKAAKDAILGTK